MSYRTEFNKVDAQVPFTLRKIFKWVLIVAALVVPLYLTLQSTGIISRDIDREVTQHSRQYVETKVSLLFKLHGDYIQLESEIAEFGAGEGNEQIILAKKNQKVYTYERLKIEASRIPEYEVPEEIRRFLSTH